LAALALRTAGRIAHFVRATNLDFQLISESEVGSKQSHILELWAIRSREKKKRFDSKRIFKLSNQELIHIETWFERPMHGIRQNVEVRSGHIRNS
jgi:hypothetical protein